MAEEDGDAHGDALDGFLPSFAQHPYSLEA